jgi:hypothetical protein
MSLDWISVLLGIIVVLIFMAIFTLLRTMSSPFIQRFTGILGHALTPVSGRARSFYLPFEYEGRSCKLLEICHEQKKGGQTIQKNYIFLEAEYKGPYVLRLRSLLQNQGTDQLCLELLNVDWSIRCSEITIDDADQMFKEIKVNTNNALKARELLSRPIVLNILNEIKLKSGSYGLFEVIPLLIEPGRVILDYRLSEPLIQQLMYDPRAVKKHINLLNDIAKELERL